MCVSSPDSDDVAVLEVLELVPLHPTRRMSARTMAAASVRRIERSLLVSEVGNYRTFSRQTPVAYLYVKHLINRRACMYLAAQSDQRACNKEEAGCLYSPGCR